MFSSVQIGLAVKSARIAAGISAKQLAERCRLTASALSKIESGRQALGFAEAAEVCSVLGIRIDHLAALSREVAPFAAETANVREQLRAELQELQKKTIRAAIAVQAAKRTAEVD